MSDTSQKASSSSRRSFIKIGAGLVVGAVAVGGAEYVYLNGALNNKDSTISGLQSQLSTAQQDVNSLAGQLNTANSQLSSASANLASAQANVQSLTAQYNSAQASVQSLTGQLSTANSSLTTANGNLAAANTNIASMKAEITGLNNLSTSLQTQLTTETAAATSANAQLVTLVGQDALITLGTQEAAVIEAAAEAIIPTDSSGPGAKEAGVIYFIDRQLFGDYGSNGTMYNKGPFIMPATAGPLTVNSSTGPITYTAGSPTTAWAAGQTYGYSMSLRNFWAYGIQALEAYSNKAYGGNFESLTAANQVKALQDLFNNVPTSFNSIIPSDFANELFFMVWAGFLMDPMYGGNRGMVGWTLTASPGLNSGNFYGEGVTPKQRMVASVPSILKPVSLAQFQQSFGVKGVQGGS